MPYRHNQRKPILWANRSDLTISKGGHGAASRPRQAEDELINDGSQKDLLIGDACIETFDPQSQSNLPAFKLIEQDIAARVASCEDVELCWGA